MKNNDIKDWVNALRSGEYKQGKDRLCIGNRYCCLGVMIDVLIDGDWEPIDNDVWSFNGNLMMPTGDLLEKLGLSLQAAHMLTLLNDKRMSFNYIADFIELNHYKLYENHVTDWKYPDEKE